MRVPQQSLGFALIFIAVLSVGRTTPAQGPTSDSAVTVVERALVAHGRQWVTGEIGDSVANGKLVLYSLDGPKAAFDLTLLRKGMARVNRVIKQPAGELKQGTDGVHSWESIAGFFTPSAQGRAMQFLESQTTRSIQRLFDYQKEGLTLRDLGFQKEERVIEAGDLQGKTTRYYLDPEKNLITKLEFTTGEIKDPFTGALLPDSDSYVFSDYRLVQGILTPFKIERISGGNKLEEMQFSSIRYNAGLKDVDFQR